MGAVQFFAARAGELVKDGAIHAALAKALRMAGNYIRKADGMTAGDSLAEVASLEGLPWMLPIPDAARWVSLAQAAHERVCAEVMSAAVSQLHSLAQTVHSATPPWEHLFATNTLDLKLATKSLLKWPRKKQLGAGVTALDSGIRAAAQTHTEWGLAGTL